MASSGFPHQRRRGRTGRPSSFWSLFSRKTGANAAAASPHEQRERSYRPRAHGLIRRELASIEFGPRTLLLAAAATIAIGAATWHILADTAAQNMALSSPSTALAWNSAQPEALNQLAVRELSSAPGEFAKTQALAGDALLHNPLDEEALFLLGVAAERRGDKAAAEKLIDFAGKRSWRNLKTQLWLLERDTRASAFESGLQHADAILRVEPELIRELLPFLAAYTASPKGLRSLSDFLTTDPPWRLLFVEILSQRLADKGHLDEIFTILREGKTPPTRRETSAYFQRLLKDGRFETAYEFWQALSPLNNPAGQLLFNGDFSLPTDGLAFNWTFTPILGAEMAVVPVDGGNGHALRVQFSGARVAFANIGQLLMLKPGQYALTGLAMASELTASRGLWWQIQCLTGQKQELTNTDLIAKSQPWSAFRASFEVPRDGCTAQSLTLVLPARIDSEKRIEGEVWFRDMRIDPRPVSH